MPPVGEHTVLLVDDEPLILEVCGAVLRSSGYIVLSSRNGRNGMELFHKHKTNIALLVSDVVMPDMRGTEMARLMLAENPDLHVVLISGYGLLAFPGSPEERFPMLAKPFTSEQLLRTVREALTEAAPRVLDWPVQSKTTVLPE